MKELSRSIWNRPWPGRRGLLAWLGLLTIATFIVIFCIGLLASGTKSAGSAASMALAAGVAALVLVAGSLFVRWLCCWRNLRRFLFALACLATLIGLFFAEENWRGRHNWAKQQRAWEAKGEKITVAALVPPPVPDDQNFAMTPLLKPILDYTQPPNGSVVWADTNAQARLQKISAFLDPPRNTNNHLVLGSLEKGAFADLPACADYYRGNTNYPQAPANASPAETILVALDKFAPELKELREAAAARPFSRFPIHYDYQPCWAILLPHLAPMKGLTQLTHVRAVAELATGRSADAFADLELGLRLSQSISNEPLLIDHLVRLAALAIDLQTVREGIHRHAWTDAQLNQIQTNLAALNLLAEQRMTYYGEQAFHVEGLNFLRQQGWGANPMYYLDSDGSSQSAFPSPFFPSGWYCQNMLTISRIMHQFAFPAVDPEARRFFPDVVERGAKALDDMRSGPYTIFAKLLLPAMAKPAERSARVQTYVDATRVACALERYRMAVGKLPETLEPLTPKFIDRIPTDVIDGKPLRYHLETDGDYVLYSVGWNQRDDGGHLVWAKDKKERHFDDPRSLAVAEGDWVWQMPK